MQKIFLFTLYLATYVKTKIIPDIAGIVGGELAKELQAPWQVWIPEQICGGSFVSNKAVLTAAHCCEGHTNSHTQVQYGGLDTTKLPFTNNVTKTIIHPKWDPNNMDGDWCLLILQDKIVESASVKIIDIADKPPVNGSIGYASGWGINEMGKATPTQLRWAQFTIVDKEECNKKWGMKWSSNTVCAQSKNASTCSGDSGGPLVVDNKLVGVDSAVVLSCDIDSTKSPNIFADTSVIKAWVLEQINKN